MPYNVNANNFSTPFSTQASIIGARNEERRLERIYGDSGPRRMTNQEELEMKVQGYRRRKGLEALAQADQRTKNFSAHVVFGGHQYTLPPTRSQEYGVVEHHGDFDAHFGGLAISKQMMDWSWKVSYAVSSHFMAARAYNAKAEKKAKGGLFKKKSTPPVLVPMISGQELNSLFNRKLAAARIPVYVQERDGSEPLFLHPSSESGDLLGEMKAWANEHWAGVPYKPWRNDLLVLPNVSEKTEYTQADADNLMRVWNDFKVRTA